MKTMDVVMCILTITAIGICCNTCVLVQSADAIVKRSEKVEEAGRITMESVDCSARCPKYSYVTGADNSEANKCSSECEGVSKQKFREILLRK